MTKSTAKHKRNSAFKSAKPSRTRRKQARIQRKASPGRGTASRLDELLRQVALIPPDVELKDLMKVYEGVLATRPPRVAGLEGHDDPDPAPRVAAGRGQKVQIASRISEEDALEKALTICLEGHDELAEYIQRRREDDTRPPGAPWFWYMFIREARQKLRSLIQGHPVPGISVDAEGVIKAERDYFAEAVDEIDSTRLRVCARDDCRRIFFGKQGRSKYCDEACRHVVANRLRRYLESQGFSAKDLKEKDRAQKAALTKAWNEAHGIPDD